MNREHILLNIKNILAEYTDDELQMLLTSLRAASDAANEVEATEEE